MFSRKFIESGFVFLLTGVLSLDDVILLVICKLFNIHIEEYDIHLCLIIGCILIIIGLILYFKEDKQSHTLTIIGLDNINYTNHIKNPLTINIIEDCKKISKSNSNKIISSYLKNIKAKINDYRFCQISYFGIAPLPFIALAGKYYRKVKMKYHYEYHQSNDKILPLKTKSLWFEEKLKCIEKHTDSDVAVFTIETTSRINNNDLNQFKNANIFRFFIEKTRTNAISHEKQLENYSEIIANYIYKISKTNIEKIYILGACQSSLIFEIFRKLNDNRIKEIIVCNYSMKSKNKYNWGISIYNENNIEKYIELGSDVCE